MTAVAASPPLWRNRDFTALLGGQVVSSLGSRVTATAMPLLLLATTGSSADMGVVAAIGSLPFLLLHLPAGTLVDRGNRWRIMVLSHLIGAVAIVTVPIAIWLGTVNFIHLAVVSFIEGTCFVCFGLAERAAIPRIVPANQLVQAMAQNEARNRGALLAGPPLGGLLFGVSRTAPFLADVASYVIALVGLMFVRADLQPERAPVKASWWADTVAGLRWLLRQPFVRASVLLVAASNLLFQALALVLIVLAQHRGASPGAIGLVLSIFGAGGVIGALLAPRLQRLVSPRSIVIGVNWIWAALVPALAFAESPVMLGVIGAVAAFLGPMWNVVIGTYQMTLIPNEMLGRVSSAGMTLAFGALPVGSLAAGYLLESVGPVRAVLFIAVVMLAVAVAATVSPAIRHAPALPTATP
jgi:MFS family permease